MASTFLRAAVTHRPSVTGPESDNTLYNHGIELLLKIAEEPRLENEYLRPLLTFNFNRGNSLRNRRSIQHNVEHAQSIDVLGFIADQWRPSRPYIFAKAKECLKLASDLLHTGRAMAYPAQKCRVQTYVLQAIVRQARLRQVHAIDVWACNKQLSTVGSALIPGTHPFLSYFPAIDSNHPFEGTPQTTGHKHSSRGWPRRHKGGHADTVLLWSCWQQLEHISQVHWICFGVI
eukprot:364469-Chlamydomonas_euryale.AAC.2